MDLKKSIHWLAVTMENTIVLQCSNHEMGMLRIQNMSNAKVQSNNHHGKGKPQSKTLNLNKP